MDNILSTLFIYSGIIALIALFVALIAMGYIKAPPDIAFIISGLKKEPRIIIGRASFMIPFLERKDELSLKLFQVDIKTGSAVPTSEYINVQVDGVANLKINSSEDKIRRAAQMFLGRKGDELARIAQQVLEGNLREIVGKMSLTELIQDREKFAREVQNNASQEFEKMGIDIINFTVQNFSDQNKVIEDLGIDNVEKIRKAAQIARANAERDVAIAKAKAKEEANKAEASTQIQIAEQNKELAVRQAEFQRESEEKRAIADAAYAIASEQQRKIIEAAKVEVDIVQRQKQIELEEAEIKVARNKLMGSIQAQADADLHAQKQKAAGIKAIGEAEADAIRQKAEAQNQFGQAAVLEMLLNVLPKLMENAAVPLGKTEKIVMFGEGNAQKLMRDVTGISEQMLSALTEVTGIDIKQMLAEFTKQKLGVSATAKPVRTSKATSEAVSETPVQTIAEAAIPNASVALTPNELSSNDLKY